MQAETYSFVGDIYNGGQIILKWIISESVTEMWIGRNYFTVEQGAGLHYHIIRQLDPVLKDHIGLLQSVCLDNSSNTLHKAVTVQFEGARCVSFRYVTLRLSACSTQIHPKRPNSRYPAALSSQALRPQTGENS
jgi:hypothetical protein